MRIILSCIQYSLFVSHITDLKYPEQADFALGWGDAENDLRSPWFVTVSVTGVFVNNPIPSSA
jgi:hypothetical protein